MILFECILDILLSRWTPQIIHLAISMKIDHSGILLSFLFPLILSAGPASKVEPTNAEEAATAKAAAEAVVSESIHDRATPLPDYETRLREIVDRLAATGAKLVWATTTPVPDTTDGKYTGAPIVERNAVAVKVMAEKGVVVNDLFTAITPQLSTLQNPDDVHFTAAGYEFLGEKVATVIAGELE